MKEKLTRIVTAGCVLAGLLLVAAPVTSGADPEEYFEYELTYIGGTYQVTITGYLGPGGYVQIPDRIEGYWVVTIASAAFEGNTALLGVSIPDTVGTIGSGAFRGCTGLTSVTIPDWVLTIEEGAFASCTNLTNITVNPLNRTFYSVSGVLFTRKDLLNQIKLVQFPGGKAGHYDIPDGVTHILPEAFCGSSSLTTATVPAGLTTIEGGAFRECPQLTGLYFKGPAPGSGEDATVFEGSDTVVLYRLAASSGWPAIGDLWDDRPTALWSGIIPTPTATPAPTPFNAVDSGDYDGDGTSDIGIFRPETGLWGIRSVSSFYFGGPGDLPVSGDYGNDGTSDPAIFRPTTGLWIVRGITRAYFGGANDLPVPGDYDGDGRCDPGIFRRSSGLWSIRGFTRCYFGTTEDAPIPGYFSGDRPKNIAVFRPTTGLWAVRGLTRFYFGTSGDVGLAMDPVGTGTDSATIFRGGDGLWASRNLTRFYFGAGGDCPVPGDYDGGGSSDAALMRPASMLWVVRNLTQAYFGRDGDLPVTGRPCRPLTPTPTSSPSPTPHTGTPTPSPTSTPITPTPTPSVTPTPVGYKTPSPTPSVMPTVEPLIESSNSDCLGPTRLDDEPEYLDVFWETDHVAVRHYNAEYNCCLERVDVEMQVEGTQIRLYETEYVPIYCYCLCPYNVFSDISPLVPGEYTVSVYKMGSFWESATVTVP